MRRKEGRERGRKKVEGREKRKEDYGKERKTRRKEIKEEEK